MSPWTRKQVRKLLSKGSPLTAAQKDSMKAELHENPAMGHKRKGGRRRTMTAHSGFISAQRAIERRKKH